MKLVAVSVIRNEADVVETFVRHHAEIVDEMLVVDHRSVDDTPEILAELVDEGLPLRVFTASDTAFDQSRLTTPLLRRAVGEGADWVIALDADEFLTSDRDARVRPLIEALPANDVLTVPWRTYVPDPDDPVDETHLHRCMVHRRVEEGLAHSKVLVPGELARREPLTIGHGNHHVRVRRRFKLRRLEARPAPDLVLAHFPVRSTHQITLRALTAWPVRLARGASPDKHWNAHDLFRRVASGRGFDRDELRKLGAAYAQPRAEGPVPENTKTIRQPVVAPGAYELRRPHQSPASLEVGVAELLESFAAELGTRAVARLRRGIRRFLSRR